MGRLITSHGSSQYVEKTDKLWNMVANEIDLEDIYEAANGDTEKIDHFFHSLKEFPEYRYVVVHLCESLSLSYEEEEIDRLFNEIEQGGELSGASDEILTDIATVLQQRYKENSGEDGPDVEEIKAKLIDFSEEFLIKFLIWAAVEDDILLDAYLTGVLKRQGLDYYDPDEFLLYAAFRYEYVGTYSRYSVYKRLKEIYDAIPERKDWDEKETKAEGTLHIQKTSDDRLEGLDLCLDEEITPELYELFEWHKSLVKPNMRTIGIEYKRLFDEVVGLYQIDVENFKRICRKLKEEKKKGQIGYLRKNHEICLTVEYDGRVDENVREKAEGTPAVVMKKGTEFAGEEFFFTLGEDVIFPRMKRIEGILVPVQSLSDLSAPGKESTLPSDAELFLCDKMGRIKQKQTKEFEVMIKTFPAGQSKNVSWQGKQKPAYNKAGDKEGKGYILISARPGFKIKAGETYFAYKYEGKTYLFSAKEDSMITWKKNIYPYYFVMDVEEQLKKRKKVSQEMEKAGISYTIMDLHKADGHVIGLENIRDIINKDKVVFAPDETSADAEDAEGTTGDDGSGDRAPDSKISADNTDEFRAPMHLTVLYPANQSVLLPKQTVLKADYFLTKNRPTKMKPEQQNSFFLVSDELLPAKNTWKLSVQVVSEDKEKRKGAVEEFLKPEKSTIRWEQKGNGPKILSVSCSSKKPRLYGDKTKGYFDIVCECGTVIDDSVRFSAVMDGEEYVFKPAGKNVTADSQMVEHSIDVYPVEKDLFCFSTLSGGAKVIAKANTYYNIVGGREGLPEMKISGSEKYAWMEKGERELCTPASEFLEYMFSLEDYDSFSRYTPEIDRDNFSVPWFENMFIQEWSEAEFGKLPPSQARSILVTLIFMKAAKEKENLLLGKQYVNFSKEFYSRFVRQVNEVMETCRLDEFYPGHPCDCLLAYLFACDSSIDALRILFKLNKRGARRNVNGKL